MATDTPTAPDDHDAAFWRALLVKYLANSAFGPSRVDMHYTEAQDQAIVEAMNEAYAMWKAAR